MLKHTLQNMTNLNTKSVHIYSFILLNLTKFTFRIYLFGYSFNIAFALYCILFNYDATEEWRRHRCWKHYKKPENIFIQPWSRLASTEYYISCSVWRSSQWILGWIFYKFDIFVQNIVQNHFFLFIYTTDKISVTIYIILSIIKTFE